MKYYLYEEKDGEYKEVNMARLKSALEEVCEKSWNEAYFEPEYLASLIGLEWDSETGKVIR